MVDRERDRLDRLGVWLQNRPIHNDEEREIDHNVYSLSEGNKFDIGLAPRGESDLVQFDSPGIVKFFCSVHKNMEGTIVVVPRPHVCAATPISRPPSAGAEKATAAQRLSTRARISSTTAV